MKLFKITAIVMNRVVTQDVEAKTVEEVKAQVKGCVSRVISITEYEEEN